MLKEIVMFMSKVEEQKFLAQEREAIFDERKAIQLAVQDLKEQTRMDYELYFESRRVRNEQISILLERLRELDERDKIVELKYSTRYNSTQNQEPSGVATPEPTKEKETESMQDQLLKAQLLQGGIPEVKLPEKRDIVASRIREQALSNTHRTKSKKVPQERIEQLIMTYLTEHGESQIRFIQKYVEETVNQKWSNFSATVKKIMERNKRIQKGHKMGYYYLADKD